MDVDFHDDGMTLTSVDETTGERQTEMDESQETREEFRHEASMHRVLLYSWQLAGEVIQTCRRACLKLSGSVRSWNRRECVRRAAETIRLLLSYLSLYGGCTSGGGGGGFRTLIPNNIFSKTRSRQGIFSPRFAQRVFSCTPIYILLLEVSEGRSISCLRASFFEDL